MKNKSQEGGDGSTNYQAETINIVGVTAGEVRAIAHDLIRAEIAGFRAEAATVAESRVSELVDRVIEVVGRRGPELFDHFRDPAVQMAMKSAERAYVRSGKPELLEVLTQTLTSRLEYMANDAVAVVLDEAIDVAAKLTEAQLCSLTACFIFSNTRATDVKSFDGLKAVLANAQTNVVSRAARSDASFGHLEYAGCIRTRDFVSNAFASTIKHAYGGLFSNGFDVETLDDELKPLLETDAFLPCLHDRSLMQVNAMVKEVIDDKAKVGGWSQSQREKMNAIFNSTLMPDEKVKEIIIGWRPENAELFSFWEETPAHRSVLTSVGMALGISNSTKLTGRTYDIQIWIN